MQRNPPPSANSAKKRSVSKNHLQKSSIEVDVEDDFNSTSRVQTAEQRMIQTVSTLVEGDEYFAPMKYLTSYRVDRQEHQHQFSLEELGEQQEDSLKEQISMLIHQSLVRKMFSFNQKRVS